MNTVLFGRLIAKEEDMLGYIVYVFENLDYNTKDYSIFEKYLMCVRYPRWNCREIQLEEEGFVRFKEVEAGESYFNVSSFVPYIYYNIQFIYFI